MGGEASPRNEGKQSARKYDTSKGKGVINMTTETLTFTQEQLDEKVQEALASYRAETEEILETIRNGAELPEGETDYKQQYIDNTKKVALLDAGVKFDDLDEYLQYIPGETAEEIGRAISVLLPGDEGKQKAYADPASARDRKTRNKWNPFA